MTSRKTVWIIAFLFIIAAIPAAPRALTVGQNQPMRIVITNDDGIEDLEDRLYPLAQALMPFAETYIVIPSRDRSGSTNFISIGKFKRALESELIHVEGKTDKTERLEIHVVEGFPADCVSLAVGGILRDKPPDLVIAGINGGANLGDAWLGSGTIGAARMAAFYGIPAMAISGIDDDLEGAVDAVTAWVARLARSPLVLNLEPGQYLTVGLPRLRPADIKGIRIAPRAPSLGTGYFERTQELRRSEERTVWLAQMPQEMASPPDGTDVALYMENIIIITPMRVDEHDYPMLKKLAERIDEIPEWKSPHL
jgi:5'-nucleotidase